MGSTLGGRRRSSAERAVRFVCVFGCSKRDKFSSYAESSRLICGALDERDMIAGDVL